MAKDQMRSRERIDSHGETGHPEEDGFIGGKIGSGYMSTIEGQPNMEDAADKLDNRTDKNKIKNIKEKTSGPVKH